jgi:hypothetical protein
MTKKFRRILLGLGAVAVGMQLIPVDRENPPVTRELAWDSPPTRDLAVRACFDCHSNETVWPWYSYVAPISFRVSHHVTDGRRHLNFSTWDEPNEDLDEVLEQIEAAQMPLEDYLLMHGEARLTDQEKEQLLNGLKASFAADPPVERRRRSPSGPAPSGG